MKYKPNYPELLRKYALEHDFFGATVIDIAKVFGVSRDLVYKWMDKYPDFLKAVTDIRERVNDNVENALLKSALGFNYEERKLVRDGVGADSNVVQSLIVQKYKAPDVASIKYWLNNKRPDKWSDKQSIESSGTTTVYIHDKDLDML